MGMGIHPAGQGRVPTGHILPCPSYRKDLHRFRPPGEPFDAAGFQRIKTILLSTSTTSKASADKLHVWLFYTGHWKRGGKHRKCRIASSPAYLTRIIQVTQYMGFKRQPLAKKNETALIDAKEMLVYRYNRISNLPGWLGPWILKTCRTRCREWSPITMGNGGASSYNLIGAKNLPSSLSCHRDVVLYIPHHNLTIQSCKACAKECQNACVQRKELGGNWDVQLRI